MNHDESSIEQSRFPWKNYLCIKNETKLHDKKWTHSCEQLRRLNKQIDENFCNMRTKNI